MAELITNYYKYPQKDEITNETRTIIDYIGSNSPCENYNNLIQNDRRFFVSYHLSDNSSSILRWYPFKDEASVLEIGGEYGAITGALCDKCREVVVIEQSLIKARAIARRYSNRNNLKIYVGELSDIDIKKRFDYVVCMKELEYVNNQNGNGYLIFLNRIFTMLSDDGVLLLCADNQYGIKYLSGQRDIHSGIPFDSLAGYPNYSKGKGFNRAEIINILNNSNFVKWKFFYPFPDHISPRAIYTDLELPTRASIERLVNYYPDSSTMVADDFNMYKDIIDNGAYQFTSNSFFIEIGKQNAALSEIRKVILSGYRPRNKAFATVITVNNRIYKYGLFQESCEYVNKLQSIAEQIGLRGISILPIEAKNNRIDMEYKTYPTVMDHIRNVVECREKPDIIINIFECLWKDILRSSDIVDDDSKLGPILATAYLEMIPLNAFWHDNNGLLYFDQEYIKEKCPAKYVLFRGIYHSFGMIDGLDKLVERDSLFLHFGITSEMQLVFMKMEQELEKRENPRSIFCDGVSDKEQQSYNRHLLSVGR